METVALRCAGCGGQWTVTARADGTMPASSRCPRKQGGCGKLRKVPRAAGRATAATVPAPGWDPPSVPRQPRPCDGPCPHCGAHEVYAEARGTVRACLACRRKVIPPGVLAPYERGTEVTRAAKSQRERDLEALALAGRKGVMLGELRNLADDGRLDDASAMKVEWFAEQVKTAANGGRLDDLAGLFAAERIRPRGSFQRPVAITAGYDGEDEEYDEDDEDDEDQADDEAAPISGPAAAAVLATPAGSAALRERATWADAFAAHGWRLAPLRGDSACQVVERGGQRCAEEIGGHPPVSDGLTRDGWTCSGHYYALAETSVSINRARGLT